MGHDTFAAAVRDPGSNRVIFLLLTVESLNHRSRSVKYGNGVASVLRVAVNIRDFRSQQSVCLHSDLVRRAVVDVEGARAAADLNAQRFPGERLLKNAL